MANTRMLPVDLFDKDEFLDISKTAQLVYIALVLKMDDDGIGKPSRRLNASKFDINDDEYQNALNELKNIGYIIEFEDGYIAIFNWHEFNHVQRKWYKPTKQQELYNRLCGMPEYISYDTIGQGRAKFNPNKKEKEKNADNDVKEEH